MTRNGERIGGNVPMCLAITATKRSEELEGVARFPWVVSTPLLVKPDVRISRIRLSLEIISSPTEGSWSASLGVSSCVHLTAIHSKA